MSYRLEGTYFENCNCTVVCPCGASNLALPATNERCHVLLNFHVASGEIDGVDVSGKNVSLFADTPAQMTDGNWRVGLVVDESASDEQRQRLVSVFSGEQGGAPALFGPLVGEVMGVEYAPIDYRDDGRRHSVRIGELADVEIEDFAGAEEGSVMTLNGIGHPAGSTLTLAQAKRARFDLFGIDEELSGKNGHAAPFSWTG